MARSESPEFRAGAFLSSHWPSVCTPAGPARADASRCVAVHLHRHLGPAWLVSTTCPSTPAVPRPALRCVTCRTLTSVFDQLRSISFCRFLTLARSPLLRRLEDPAAAAAVRPPRSAASPQLPGVAIETGRASGPQVRSPRCPTCPSVPALLPLRLKGSPAHVSPLSAGHPPGIRPVMRRPSGRRSRCCDPRFPAAFRPPAFASWASCPARDSAPLTVGLPPSLRIPAPAGRTLTRFPRSARMRPGPGRAPSIPRGRRCSLAVDLSAAAACRLSAAGPWHPGTATQPGMYQ